MWYIPLLPRKMARTWPRVVDGAGFLCWHWRMGKERLWKVVTTALADWRQHCIRCRGLWTWGEPEAQPGDSCQARVFVPARDGRTEGKPLGTCQKDTTVGLPSWLRGLCGGSCHLCIFLLLGTGTRGPSAPFSIFFSSLLCSRSSIGLLFVLGWQFGLPSFATGCAARQEFTPGCECPARQRCPRRGVGTVGGCSEIYSACRCCMLPCV